MTMFALLAMVVWASQQRMVMNCVMRPRKLVIVVGETLLVLKIFPSATFGVAPVMTMMLLLDEASAVMRPCWVWAASSEGSKSAIRNSFLNCTPTQNLIFWQSHRCHRRCRD